MAMIYTVISMTALFGLLSLAVDMSRVRLVKSDLQDAADAAARYAVTGLSNSTAVTRAQQVAIENTVDGIPHVLDASDVETGVWNVSTRVFTPTNVAPNAVRVTARCLASRGNGVDMWFAQIIGVNEVDVKASAVAFLSAGGTGSPLSVSGRSCVWLADRLPGNYSGSGGSVGTTPACSPTLADGVSFVAGDDLQFTVTGNARHMGSGGASGPDGRSGTTNYTANYMNGMSNVTASLNTLIGVFLTDGDPAASAAPANLNFASPGSRNFSTLSPQLKQVFFIGDGLRNDGTTRQNFVVPAGATRLMLGIMDSYGWNDNSGAWSVTMSGAANKVLTVW